MIKFSPAINYRLYFTGRVKGKVQETDVTGALFAHTNQIYSKFALVKLQNRGVVGKIEIDLQHNKVTDVTQLVLQIPHNGTQIQASVLVALIETVNRISLYQCQIKFRKVEQVGKDTSAMILRRSYQVYTTAFAQRAVVDPVEKLEQLVSQKAMTTIGRFTVGASFKDSEQVIVVEGRNDVVALGNAKITNVIGVGGIRYDLDQLTPLLQGKRLTLMCDGNAGGLALQQRLIKEYPDQIRHIAAVQKGVDVEDLPVERIREVLRDKTRYP